MRPYLSSVTSIEGGASLWTHAVIVKVSETIVEQAIQLSSTDIHLQCGQPNTCDMVMD